VEKVFKAWTEPHQMSKWMGCDQVNQIKVVQDFRVGGEYRIQMSSDEGVRMNVWGTFKEIEENRKLVYSWTNDSEHYPAKDTLVSVEFIARGDTTEIILKHSKFATQEVAEGHTSGWGHSLEQLELLFA